MSPLFALDAARCAFDYQFAGHHQTEAIALLRFFQIVRGQQNCGAHIRQSVNHRPECAARQWIHARGRFVEKEHTGFMHDRGTKRNALLPSSGEAARELLLLSLEPGESQHPLSFFLALVLGDAVHAGIEFEVLLDRKVVIQGELLRHVTDFFPHTGRTYATCASQLYFALGLREQSAEHLNGCSLARAVRAEQTIYLAISNLQSHILDGSEFPKSPREVPGPDCHLAPGVLMRVTGRKG